jgi:hypothetical protein
MLVKVLASNQTSTQEVADLSLHISLSKVAAALHSLLSLKGTTKVDTVVKRVKETLNGVGTDGEHLLHLLKLGLTYTILKAGSKLHLSSKMSIRMQSSNDMKRNEAEALMAVKNDKSGSNTNPHISEARPALDATKKTILILPQPATALDYKARSELPTGDSFPLPVQSARFSC